MGQADDLRFAADTVRTAKAQAAAGNTTQARQTLNRGIAEAATPNDKAVMGRVRGRLGC